MWGQAVVSTAIQTNGGIIPTRVGTRQLKKLNSIHTSNHPHACGDKTPKIVFADQLLGSSPRVWGQVTLSAPSQPVRGIIPTRVGTRNNIFVVKLADEDHPHACGDKKYVWRASFECLGSSPRVWGQVLAAWNTYKNDRIIPTRVGTRAEEDGIILEK